MINDEKDRMMFLEGEDFGGGGGDDGESRGQAVFDEPQAGAEQAPEGPQEPSTAQAGPPPAVVDARALASEFGQVIGQHFQPPPKEMTAEEAKRLLNVWEPSKEWLAKYDNLESREQALAELRDGLIRQSDTITQYRLREMMGQMQQAYGPVVQYMQQMEAKSGEARFREAYPELGVDGVRPLLFAVSQNLLAQGVPFRSEAELFAAIAGGVEAVIKVSNPEFKLNGGNRGVAPNVRRKSGPPVAAGGIPVTTPGSGGGGGMKGPALAKPRGLAIFDP